MLGYDQSTAERAAGAEGVILIDLKFDTTAEAWAKIRRADLVFEDVDHIGPSFEIRAFLNNRKANGDTERTAENGYAGRLVVFGHGDCVGGEGHCATERARPGMSSAPAMPVLQNPAAPQRMMLLVTKALDRVMKRYKRGLHTVTLVTILQAPRKADCRPQSGLLRCKRVSLRTYG